MEHTESTGGNPAPDKNRDMDRPLWNVETRIREWHDKTFPDGTPNGVMVHMRREFMELQLAYQRRDMDIHHVAEELADLFILSVALGNFLGISVTRAVCAKMVVNMQREWQPPDDQGVIEHKREKAEP